MGKKIFIFIFCFFLSGCIGGTSIPSKFYVLDGTASSNISKRYSLKTEIGVEEFKIPHYLNRPQIVTQDVSSVTLKVSESHRWSEPLSTMLQRVLADDLSVYLPDSLVKPKINSRESFKYTIFVEINSFDGILGDKATLEAWWSIMSTRENKILYRDKSKFSRSIGDSYEDLVIAQSNLLEELSLKIVKALIEVDRSR